MTTYVTIHSMGTSAKSVSFSHFLRNSGEVLEEVKHVDVRLARRDGPDIFLGTDQRERAVRDSLGYLARALSAVLRDPVLGVHVTPAISGELSWLGWLSEGDQSEFLSHFLATIRACEDTGGYEPLSRLLNRWRASAQIMHDPELASLLVEDRGEDSPISVNRPEA
jgi:hypothetical protein